MAEPWQVVEERLVRVEIARAKRGATGKTKPPTKLAPTGKLLTVIIWFTRHRPLECFYCGVDLFTRPEVRTIDHVIPKSANGRNGYPNTVPCCERCNFEKRSRSADDFRLHRFGTVEQRFYAELEWKRAQRQAAKLIRREPGA